MNINIIILSKHVGINIPATLKTEESKEVIKSSTIQSVKEQTDADRNHLSTMNNEQNNKTEVDKTLRPKDRLKVKSKDIVLNNEQNNKPEQEKTLTLKEKLQIFENPIL